MYFIYLYVHLRSAQRLMDPEPVLLSQAIKSSSVSPLLGPSGRPMGLKTLMTALIVSVARP